MKKFDLIFYQCTTECNLHCPYCYDWKLKSEELSSDDIRKHFKFKAKYLVVTGGELCIKKDIVGIIGALLETSEFEELVICSNFLFPLKLMEIVEHNSKMLRKLSGIKFSGSIDGIGDTHDRIRGKGSFDKTIETIKMLKKLKLPNFSICINMCIIPDNYHEITDVFELAKHLNIKFTYCFPHPLDRKDIVFNDFMYDSIENQLRKIGLFDANRFEIFRYKKRNKQCTAGKTWCVVHPNGDVLPCWNPQSALNLKTNSMAEIIKGLQNFNPNDCTRCDHLILPSE